MNAPVFGYYQPGDGWLFRLPVGAKYLLVLALTIPPLVITTWWVTLIAIGVVLLLLVSSGVSARRALGLGWVLWMVLGVLAVYHLIALHPLGAIVHPGNILVAVLAARILTLTTPTPVLIDALVAALRPIPGINEEKVALAIALMLRSIPYLVSGIDDARTAARARGLDRNPALLLTPVLLGAVAYAERTGEALAARGLPDR